MVVKHFKYMIKKILGLVWILVDLAIIGLGIILLIDDLVLYSILVLGLVYLSSYLRKKYLWKNIYEVKH